MLKNSVANADSIPMLVTNVRSNRGVAGTLIAILVLVTSRMQFDRNQPPGAVGASFDVATHQITTAVIAVVIGGVVLIALAVRRRRA